MTFGFHFIFPCVKIVRFVEELLKFKGLDEAGRGWQNHQVDRHSGIFFGYFWTWGRSYHWQVMDIRMIDHHLSLDVRFILLCFEDAWNTTGSQPKRPHYVCWSCLMVKLHHCWKLIRRHQIIVSARSNLLQIPCSLSRPEDGFMPQICKKWLYTKGTERPPRAVASQASEVSQSRIQNKGTCGWLSRDVQKTRVGQMNKCFSNYRQDVFLICLLFILLLRTWVMDLMAVGAKRWKSLGLH